MSLQMKKILIILVLMLIGYVLHRPFFDINGLLFYSDRANRSNAAVKDLFFKWLMTWQSHSWFGQEYPQASFFWFKFFRWLIGNFAIATKLTFFIPIALLSFVSPFIFSSFLTKNNLPVAFVVSLFYGTITYFSVKSTAHLPIAMVFVLAPIILTFFVKYISTHKLHDLLLFNLFYFIGIVYEIRIMLIVTGILVFTLLFFTEKDILKKLITWLGISILLQLLLNAYRLLPVLHLSWSAISEVTQRWLFGNHLFTLSYALTLFESSRTGWAPTQEFIAQSLPFYMRFYPTVVLLWFFCIKEVNRKLFLWWIGLFFIGVVLTKQAALPMRRLYQFLYEHVPWFNLFREASKYYQVTAIAYLIILSVVWDAWWKKSKVVTWIFLVASLGISSILAYPLLTGSIWLIRIPNTIPEAYNAYNRLVDTPSVGYKTLWIPSTSPWTEYSIERPKVSFNGVISSTRKDVYTWDLLSMSWKIVQLTNELLDRGNITYVVIPREDVNKNLLSPLGAIEIKTALDTLPFLESLDLWNSWSLQVYINTGWYGEVFSTNISWITTWCNREKVKSSEVVFNCNFSNDSIVFSQQYNTQRRLYTWSPHRRDIIRWTVHPIALPEKELDGLMKFTFPIQEKSIYTLYFVPEAWFVYWIYISCLWIILLISSGIYSMKKK
jgi:hypothetical protein